MLLIHPKFLRLLFPGLPNLRKGYCQPPLASTEIFGWRWGEVCSKLFVSCGRSECHQNMRSFVIDGIVPGIGLLVLASKQLEKTRCLVTFEFQIQYLGHNSTKKKRFVFLPEVQISLGTYILSGSTILGIVRTLVSPMEM